MAELINLWLDDIRPSPEGWVHVRNIEDAKKYLQTGLVFRASLDHDLGACEACMNGRTIEQWLAANNFSEMPNCEHVGTGYQLVCWMEETGNWPLQKPRVHSANPAGRAKMLSAINGEYDDA